MLQSEDKSYLTKWFVGTALVSTLLVGGLLFTEIYLLMRANGPSGDTPVVLIGDSMIFKATDKDRTYQWRAVTANKEYTAVPTYSIETIALKQKTGSDNDDPVSDDGDTTSDLFGVGVSAASSWKIDEYANDSDINPVVTISLAQGGLTMDLKVNDSPTPGYLCPVKGHLWRLQYGQQPNCSDAGSFKFYKAILTVTTNGQAESPQILPCTNRNGSKGKCRIVLRGPTS